MDAPKSTPTRRTSPTTVGAATFSLFHWEALPVFLERNLAVVLPEEVQESLVVASLHVEEPRHDLIVSARFLETSTDDFTHVGARDFSVHEQRIHRGPERLVLFDHALVEIIRDGASTFPFWPQQHGVVRPDLRRQMLDANRRSADRDYESLDGCPHGDPAAAAQRCE